jgi:hypothetical protein
MRGRRILWSVALATVLVAGSHSVVFAQLTTEDEVRAKVESQGYREARDIKFGPEGITLKATKDGRERSLIVDSAGKIIEQP